MSPEDALLTVSVQTVSPLSRSTSSSFSIRLSEDSTPFEITERMAAKVRSVEP